MSKPWKSEPGGASLEAYLGAYGVKTSQIETTEELIFLASQIYEIPSEATVSAMASRIGSLSKKSRSALARKNIPLVVSGLIDSGPPSKSPGDGIITESSLDRMMSNSKPHLVDGGSLDVDGDLDIDPAQLLRKVVSAVISSGHADILCEFPEVLAYFKARIPWPEEVTELHNVDEQMFAAKDKWLNVRRRES